MTKTTVIEFEGGKHHVRGARAVGLKEGDVIVHLEGVPARIRRTSQRQDEFGWVYQFEFDGLVPFAARGHDIFKVLVPFPKVGDGATLRVGSDTYPFTVVSVSTAGGRIGIRKCRARRIDSNGLSEQQEYEYDEDESAPVRLASWSPTKGRYHSGGSPLSIGVRRYYQDPSF